MIGLEWSPAELAQAIEVERGSFLAPAGYPHERGTVRLVWQGVWVGVLVYDDDGDYFLLDDGREQLLLDARNEVDAIEAARNEAAGAIHRALESAWAPTP